MRESDVAERWMVSLLEQAPAEMSGFRPVSTFYTEADLIVANTELVDRTYAYKGTGVWWRVGPQILTVSGWRPDCARLERTNVARAEPPRVQFSAPIVIGSPDATRWYSDAARETLVKLLNTASRVLRIEVES